MGAYYEAVITRNNQHKRYHPHDLNNGSKLTEHSYIGNDYMNYIISQLKEPGEYLHLCDYHEPDDISQLTWDNLPAEEQIIIHEITNLNFIINHTNKSWIDFDKLNKLSQEQTKGWIIHPIPILCNSELHSAGGGDYHPEDSRRATWANHILQTTDNFNDIPIDYKDVTSDCLFFE